MTKYLTTAAWAALVLGGVAVAETPPSESADAVIEDTAAVETEAPKDITTADYSDEVEADAETDMDDTAASETAEAEASAGGEAPEADDASEETTDSE